MTRLKRRDARGIVRLLGSFGFEVISMHGSHTKLARSGPTGRRDILIVPMHRQLTAGTLHAIYKQASRFIPDEALRHGFFTD